MKKSNKLTSSNEIVSLNTELYSEFQLSELEQRLETDPLIFVGLMSSDPTADSSQGGDMQRMSCPEFNNCDFAFCDFNCWIY